MARKKVKLAWIANDSTRRATFKKRKKGLMKKAQELSTLCDVKTCVVVYGAQESQAEAWPSVEESQRVLRRFKSMPETEQSKKMVDQEGFLRQRLSKAQDQLRRLERENREFDTCLLMHDALTGQRGLDALPIQDATALAWLVEMRLKSVQERIQHLRSSAPPAHVHAHAKASSSSQPLPGPSMPAPSQSPFLAAPLPQQMQMQMQMPMPTEAADVPVETSGMPSWYANPGDSIAFGRTDEMMSMQMQPYLDAASAWNNYLHLN